MIVEDDPSSGNALKYLLSTHGWNTQVVGTLALAIESVNLTPPDAVILDLMLPDGDGLTLLKFLREKNPKARVIIATGVLDPQWLERAQSLDRVTVLKKPIWMDELLKHLQE